MATLVATGFVVLAASLAVGFFLTHDMRLTPSLMFTGCALAVVVVPGLDWNAEAGDQEAWFVAMAMYLALLAAMIERDRLAARDGPPIPWLWNGVRAGIVGVWTVLVLVYRENLEAGRVFAWFGADPTGFEGQFLLVAILVAAVLLAALAFRAGRPRQQAPPG
jgi:hypothetical protein